MTMPDTSHCMGVTDGARCTTPLGAQCYTWERWGTPEEIALFHSTGDLPANETECKVPVVGCEPNEHIMSLDEMTRTHDADCQAPMVLPCACSQSDANQGA
jgi:hypothetical protein